MTQSNQFTTIDLYPDQWHEHKPQEKHWDGHNSTTFIQNHSSNSNFISTKSTKENAHYSCSVGIMSWLLVINSWRSTFFSQAPFNHSRRRYGSDEIKGVPVKPETRDCSLCGKPCWKHDVNRVCLIVSWIHLRKANISSLHLIEPMVLSATWISLFSDKKVECSMWVMAN